MTNDQCIIVESMVKMAMLWQNGYYIDLVGKAARVKRNVPASELEAVSNAFLSAANSAAGRIARDPKALEVLKAEMVARGVRKAEGQ